jgi:hypothetical protein
VNLATESTEVTEVETINFRNSKALRSQPCCHSREGGNPFKSGFLDSPIKSGNDEVGDIYYARNKFGDYPVFLCVLCGDNVFGRCLSGLGAG